MSWPRVVDCPSGRHARVDRSGGWWVYTPRRLTLTVAGRMFSFPWIGNARPVPPTDPNVEAARGR